MPGDDKDKLTHAASSDNSSGSQPNTPNTQSLNMETFPADFIDGGSEEEGNEEDNVREPWGKLFPLGDSFVALDLSKDEYSFGRGELCDYQFNSPSMMKHKCYPAYSKVHFKLVREETSTGTHVFLVDTSSNGTFINGKVVGKGCKQVLNNNDEISLAMARNKGFMFMDSTVRDDKDLPEAFNEKYTMSRLLGRGACGEVKLAFTKGTCNKVAVKIIKKKTFSIGGTASAFSSTTQIMNEVQILKALNHPCIIAIQDVIDTPDTMYIVLELVEGGELFDKVVSVGHFDEPTTKLLFYQMVAGIKYLHDQGISHRDLKPENILMATDGLETLVKITDFGLSKFIDPTSMMKTFCGTPNYLAPEILLGQGKGEYTCAIDCWSLGVILFICLVGYPPFSEDRTDMPLPKQILKGAYTHYFDDPDGGWKEISDDAQDLVKKMLTLEPEDRISMADVLKHPWMSDEGIKQKAHKLWYPESDGMIPPQSIPRKRKAEGSPVKSPKKVA